MVTFNPGISQISLLQLPLSGLLSRVYFSRCRTNGELAYRLRMMMMMVMMTIIMMIMIIITKIMTFMMMMMMMILR